MFGFINKNKNKKSSNHQDFLKEILDEERYQKNVELDKLNIEYKEIIDEFFKISETLMYDNTYSKAINNENIYNEHSEKYIILCNRLLQLLPKKLEYEKKLSELNKRECDLNYCYSSIINMIKLLFKQEKYNEIINVCKYLLSLGITEDKTKKGIKGRIEQAVIKFNNKFGTNYIYESDKNIIIDLETGEVME